MSYQQKLDSARSLLVQHNSQVSEDSKARVNVDSFFNELANAGGTNDAALSQSSWEDLQEFGLPKLLARQVATIFRAKEEKVEKPVLKKSKVEAMTIDDLIAHYDPRNPTSLVTERLSVLLDDKRFVVFKNDGSVDGVATTKLAKEVLDNFPERELYVVDDVPSRTYRLNERPDQSFDENPLYPTRILRPDGDCDQTNRSWSGVPLNVKQTLYLSLRTGELKIQSINDAHDVLDLVMGKTDEEALKTVRRRFPKATAQLKEMVDQGIAPGLKIFKKTVGEVRKQDPFSSHKSY